LVYEIPVSTGTQGKISVSSFLPFSTASTHSGLSGLSIIALRKDYSPSETRFGVETAESDFCPMGYVQAPSIKKPAHGGVLG
jgi:hypothetical protein